MARTRRKWFRRMVVLSGISALARILRDKKLADNERSATRGTL
ncbi:MAG TPA: hypothetical protein VM030_04585 [Acidimicrobiales bacterium]|nr:hypothetical protein [Acidimicrobiales bacterium]